MDKNKRIFLDRYNPTGSNEMALRKAWGASVQHNLLYSTDDVNIRRRIFLAWQKKVEPIAQKSIAFEEYEPAILQLQSSMNEEFGQHFNVLHGGFRLSHAQKGLSVYLKHLWCIGTIQEPPQCPIDRRIITIVAHDHRHLANIRWTTINHIEVHSSIISAIKDIAKNETIAAWELNNYPIN